MKTDGEENDPVLRGVAAAPHLDPPPAGIKRRFQPDDRIGRYEVRSLLGTGGMGEVYVVFDSRLQREIAVKVLPAPNAGDPAWVARFEREARALGMLNHPNIVAVHDFGAEDDVPYLVTELLVGETLRARLSSGAVPLPTALDWAQQIVSGLAAAHARGVIHRDLKPENLFITREGRVKILDFGIAKLASAVASGHESTLSAGDTEADGLTATGEIVGTVGYMSPEQVRGGVADARSDIFSFGAVLYELVTGRRAFPGDTRPEIAVAVMKEEPPPMTVPSGRIPPDLEGMVRHCLAKRPEDRYQTAEDLKTALASLSMSAVGAPMRSPRSRARRIGWFILASATAVAAALGAIRWVTDRDGGPVVGQQPVLAQAVNVPPERPPAPRFTRVTFTADAAWGHLAPDGQTFVFVRWSRGIPSVHLGRIGSEQTRPLGLENTVVADVSATGELLIWRNLRWEFGAHTLSRIPLMGGTPRDLATDVVWSSWSPDGTRVSAIRRLDGKYVLEYPLGTIVYTSPTPISGGGVSPRDGRFAISDHPLQGDTRGSIALIDHDGKKRTLTREFEYVTRPVWAPDGNAIYFSASDTTGRSQVWTVDLDGKERMVANAPDSLIVTDVTADGRLLVHRAGWVTRVRVKRSSDTDERDLSAHEVWPRDISEDGQWVLLVGSGPVPGIDYKIYLQRTDGSPPVLIGEGDGWARLSPDGKYVLTGSITDRTVIRLLPTGPGTARDLPAFDLKQRQFPQWIPDGRGVIFFGTDASGRRRLYAQPVDQGPPRAFGRTYVMPESIGNLVSPDGRWVAAQDTTGAWGLEGVDDGKSRALPQINSNESVPQWTADGHSLYVASYATNSIVLAKLHIATGRRSHVATVNPANVDKAGDLFLNRRATAWVYTLSQGTMDLYLVDFPPR